LLAVEQAKSSAQLKPTSALEPPLEYAPPPIPPWALRRPFVAIWYAISRFGDHGRLRPIRRLTHITAHLYLGGQINLAGWQRMERWGVNALVNLRVEWDDRRSGINAEHYLWLPTIDGTPSTVEQLARGVEFIHEQVQARRKTYVHCAAGLGRSPTLIVAYLMTRGFTAETARDFILARRPFIALSKRQLMRLEEFERYSLKHHLNYERDALIDPLEPTEPEIVNA
jgi:protein-tyrosine phosphatase